MKTGALFGGSSAYSFVLIKITLDIDNPSLVRWMNLTL